jgi:hypothetical protein
MSIIAWIVLGLIAGFIGSKLVNKTGEGGFLGRPTQMAKPKPETSRESEPAGTTRVLPMQLQISDRLTEETGEWEVVGRP